MAAQQLFDESALFKLMSLLQ